MSTQQNDPMFAEALAALQSQWEQADDSWRPADGQITAVFLYMSSGRKTVQGSGDSYVWAQPKFQIVSSDNLNGYEFKGDFYTSKKQWGLKSLREFLQKLIGEPVLNITDAFRKADERKGAVCQLKLQTSTYKDKVTGEDKAFQRVYLQEVLQTPDTPA